MSNLTRRGFIAVSTAAASVRTLPQVAAKPATRRILTLVYDRSLGMMRALDRVVLR